MTHDVIFEEKGWNWDAMTQEVETSTDEVFHVAYEHFAPAGLDEDINEQEADHAPSTPVHDMVPEVED